MSTGYSWLTARGLTDYYVDHVVGANRDVGTTYEPVSDSGIYRTPQIADAKQLRIRAGDVNDDIAGTGARKVFLLGIGTDLQNFFEVLDTAGTSASALTSRPFLRLLRVAVHESGTYASVGTYSHAADIVVEDSGGVQWGSIDATTIPRGIAQIGLGTVPTTLSNGDPITQMFITGYVMTVDGNKNADFMLMHRDGITQTSAPYSSLRVTREHLQVSGVVSVELSVPLGPYLPGTDIGFLARADTSAAVSVDMEAVVVKE